MIRIVGIQRSSIPQQEFILLQNQGGLRVNLRGHILMSEEALETPGVCESLHVFRDDVMLGPGNFVLVYTGSGDPKWAKTKDMQLVYYTYMDRTECMWEGSHGPVHILGPQHSFVERREAILLR